MATTWRPLGRPDAGFLDQISRTIFGGELTVTGGLTSVRSGPAMIITSDYSAGRKRGPFECLSFLLVDPRSLALWEAQRRSIRLAYLSDGRRMSYKALSDNRRALALIPFLACADSLSGVLLTVAVDNQLVRQSCELERRLHACGADFSTWKQRSLLRLDAIMKLGALLVSGLSGTGQDIIWVTDDDDFVAHDQRVTEATKLFGHYISHLCAVSLGHLRFGAASTVDDGSLAFEDLAAISDLAAGALAVVMNEELELEHAPNKGLKRPMSDAAPAKARVIAGWLGSNGGNLSKLAIYVRLMPDGTCRTGAVTMEGPPGAQRLVRPAPCSERSTP